MAKVVFVNPPLGEKKVWGSFEEVGSIIPPQGLCALGAILREKGHSVRIIDSRALRLDYNETLIEIEKSSPDIVGLTASTSSMHNAARMAALIKEKNPQIIMMIGGPHISILPEETMKKYPQFDAGVMGEGEETIGELIEYYNNPKKLKQVDGLVLRDGEKIVMTNPSGFVKELDKLPFPAWDLLPDLREYYRPAITNYKRLPNMALVTSRGCYGKCTFCCRNIFGSNLRYFSEDYIVKMIEKLIRDYGILDITFYDENFLLSRSRVRKICQLMIEKKINITWSCDSRVDIVDLDTLRLMKKAGCWQIVYGVESGSQRILDFLKKGVTLEQIEKAIRLTRKAGIMTRAFFMIGIPTETKEDIRKTISFMLRLGLDDMFLSYFTPLPGSEIYEDAMKHGRFNDGETNMNFSMINYVPDGITREELKRFHKEAYQKFYLRPRQILNYALKLKDPKNLWYLLKALKVFVKFSSEKVN